MKKTIFICLYTIVSTLTSWGINGTDSSFSLTQKADEITATITKTTTTDQLNSLKDYFKENKIEVTINNVVRNSADEITGIDLLIKKGSQESNYAMNSNNPIDDLELGYRQGNVFVGNIDTSFSSKNDILLQNLFNGFNEARSNTLDSLLSQNQFSFSFGSDDIRKLLNDSSFDFDQIQNQFFSRFFNSDTTGQTQKPSKLSNTPNSSPKYHFFNTKNTKKLIVIDGEVADFKTLNTLAKADRLKDVDNLKPSTAVSIYGDSGRNGAIIVTTK